MPPPTYMEFSFAGPFPNYIRVNTLAGEIKDILELLPIKFKPTPLKEVFEVEGKERVGKLLEFKAGLIHSQSLSSAAVSYAFKEFSEKDVVLDCAAAPGSKTTHMSALMKNRGTIVANDRKGRASALYGNLSRLGAINVIMTHHDAKNLPWENKFSKVLLDAPCSALGSHKHAWERLKKNPNIPKRLAGVQKRMILQAFKALRPGGELVYSTCTITEEENEEVIDYLLEQEESAKLIDVSLPIKHSKGMEGYACSKHVARIEPKEVRSEAFFIAKITKQ